MIEIPTCELNSTPLLTYSSKSNNLVNTYVQDVHCFSVVKRKSQYLWLPSNSVHGCLFLDCPTFPRSYFTLSNHLARCAPFRLVPVGFEMNTIFAGFLSGILTTYPAHRTLPALVTFWMLGSPQSCTSSWFILFLHVPFSHTAKYRSQHKSLKTPNACRSSLCIVSSHFFEIIWANHA